jgi:hypothetical protein
MSFEPRQEIPDFPVDPRHLADRFRHFLNARIVERLGFTES